MFMLFCMLFFYENVFICNWLEIVNILVIKRKFLENIGKLLNSLKKKN